MEQVREITLTADEQARFAAFTNALDASLANVRANLAGLEQGYESAKNVYLQQMIAARPPVQPTEPIQPTAKRRKP